MVEKDRGQGSYCRWVKSWWGKTHQTTRSASKTTPFLIVCRSLSNISLTKADFYKEPCSEVQLFCRYCLYLVSAEQCSRCLCHDRDNKTGGRMKEIRARRMGEVRWKATANRWQGTVPSLGLVHQRMDL